MENVEKSGSRRKIVLTAGGAVIGAAALTAAFQLPALFQAGETAPIQGVSLVQAGAPESPGISSQQEKALDKYFAAGYDLNEGKRLATLWKMEDSELIQVKAIAGQKLLDGEKLPVKPGSPPVEQSSGELKQVNTFFAEGYDFDDAAKLAKLWKKPTPYDAKVEGGKRLLAGETLPIQP